jgi:hypothetical protein
MGIQNTVLGLSVRRLPAPSMTRCLECNKGKATRRKAAMAGEQWKLDEARTETAHIYSGVKRHTTRGLTEENRKSSVELAGPIA